MKTKVLFIVTVLITVSVFAQRGVRIAYIDMDYILENIEEYEGANKQLDAKAAQWKSEIEQKKGTIEQMRKNLSAEKILLTKELVQEREAEIQLLEKEVTKYQQDRFGPQGDLVIQRTLLAKPIQDQVFNIVQDIVKNRKYDFVFDKSADVVMLYSDKRHDISDLVLRNINRTKKQNERKGKTDKKEESEAIEENPNPVVEARKEAAIERQEEKDEAIEEKKQKKIEDREARKKAYEERKKKLLAEKEAKKKAKLEERQKKKNNTNKTDDTEENNNN